MSESHIISTITLNAGMYILRLQQQPEGEGQSISINPAPLVSAGECTFFSSTNVKNNCLSSATESMIVRIESDEATLLIAESSAENQAVLQLKVDKISDLSLKAQAPTIEEVEKITPQPENVWCSGHIEWQGDVQSNVGEYLGEPQSKNRLEGFSIEWENRPDDIDIAYSCEVEQMGRTPVALSGGFVGTRQRALAIYSISLTLVGLNADQYELSGYAAFAGGEPLAITSGIDSHGPSVTEALIAIQVNVTKKI